MESIKKANEEMAKKAMDDLNKKLEEEEKKQRAKIAELNNQVSQLKQGNSL